MGKPEKPPITINILSLWKVYRLIRKYIKQLKLSQGQNQKQNKKMCLRRWFSKPNPTPTPEPIDGIANKTISFAINDYKGTQNDLNGCVNDQTDLEVNLKELYPNVSFTGIKDSAVTRSTFLGRIESLLTSAKAGDTIMIHYSGHGTYVTDEHGDEEDGYDEALYLYDGTLVDDDLNAVLQKIPQGVTVVILLDSCFSGSATRSTRKRNRFVMPVNFNPKKGKLGKKMLTSPINWIVISGCSEHQTSADAYFSGRYNGAFTYFALKALKKGMTYKQWYEAIRTYLPSDMFEQIPTLEGPEELINKVIFE